MIEKQNIHPLICDYIASKGENGNQILRPESDGENPSPNPRKWEMASNLLYEGATTEMLRPLLGEDIVHDFSMFCDDVGNNPIRKTRLEKMNPDKTPTSRRRKVTTKEFVQNWIGAKMGPAIIRCNSGQDWLTLFDESPVIIDATKMSFAELSGTDFRKRTHFEPAWFQDLLSKKVLVIENLDMLTPRGDELTNELAHLDYYAYHAEGIPGQIDFLFLCRCEYETGDCRAFNTESPCVIPTDVSVFIVQRDNPKHQIIQEIFSRCGVIDMAWDNE